MIELLESLGEIEKKIEAALMAKLGVKYKILGVEAREKIKQVIKKKIGEHPTYISLLNNSIGELLPELGLPLDRRKWASEAMVDIIAEGVQVITSVVGFSIEFNVIWTTDKMTSLLQEPFASYISGNKLGKTVQINWLDWLIAGGSEMAVTRHHITYGSGMRGSRTGHALMKPGGNWELSKKWAGTLDNNFITQSIQSAVPDIMRLMANL